MPRPRILCSPRSKPRATTENVDQQRRIITISESEEPDCEIIKIEDSNDDKKKISLQVRGVAQVEYRGSQCLPSMLSLQFLPVAASNIEGKTGGQNVVMVVRSSASQVFNPTLCTLEKIDNPTEISEIRQVVDMQKNAALSEKNICTSVPDENQKKKDNFTDNSAENLQQINESQVFDPVNETAVIIDADVESKAGNCVLQEPSTSYSFLDNRKLSVDQINSYVSTETVDGKAGTSNLAVKKPENNAPGIGNKRIACKKISDDSGSLKKMNAKGSNYNISNTKISLSQTSIPRKNLIKNGTTADFIRMKVASDDNSNVEKKAANSGPKKLVDNKKSANFVRKEVTDRRHSETNPETDIFMPKTLSDENSGPKSKRSTLQYKKYIEDENTSEYHEFFSAATESIVEVNKKLNSPIASEMRNCETTLLWNLNCIVCNRNFTNRTKLHKHASIEHPDVHIFFCEFCNDSFLTHENLEAHRVKNCKSEITEIVETIVIEDEEDCSSLSSKEISGNLTKEKIISESNNSLGSQIMKKNRAPESPKLKNGYSGGVLIRKKRGRPRKDFSNFVATYKYVEEEVINHAVGAKKKELVTAKIRKLVIPIARLEDSTVKKYLEKNTEMYLSDYKNEEGSSPKHFRKRKRRRARKNYNNVGNLKKAPKSPRKMIELKQLKNNLGYAHKIRNDKFLRRTDKIVTRNSLKRSCREKSSNTKNRGKIVGAKQQPIYIGTDESSDDSEIKYVPVVEDDSGINKRCIIRKLPSKSSAASFVSLKTGLQNEQRQRVKISPIKTYGEWILRRQKIVDPADRVETSGKKRTDQNNRIPSGCSNTKTVDNTKLDVLDHVQFDKTSKNLEENRQQNNEKTDILKKSVTQKTYLPSKRKVLNATKRKQRCDLMSTDLCLMCKELLELMKQLESHFVGNKANKISVKCPLCNLYFISMFFLKKHVSKYHLHCQNQFPSQLSESLMLVKSGNEENLDCETEFRFGLDCHHCPEKFRDEKDLVDHVFNRHDSPIYDDDFATDFPYYVNDLPSSYVQTSDQSIGIDFSSKCRSSNVVNRLNVESKLASSSSKLLDDKAGNNSSDSSGGLQKNVTYKLVESINKLAQFNEAAITAFKSEAESDDSEDIYLASKPIKDEESTSDRYYLLKQLLSDDSNNSFDSPEPATWRYIQNVEKFSRIISVGSEKNFTCPQCHICDKEFERTQDLLIHSLEHDFPDNKCEESLSNAAPDINNDMFANPVEYDWFNEESAVSTLMESQTQESQSTAPIPKRFDTGDILFTSRDESNDFCPMYKNNDEPEPIKISRNRKSETPVSKISLGNEKTKNLCAKDSRLGNRDSKLIPEATEPQSEKLKVLQEFLETEKGFDNPDETGSTGKLPIECSKCNRKFPNQASLNEHLFFLHDDSLKATVLTDVVSPMSHPGAENAKEPRQWRCEECVHNFKLLQSYGRHRYFVHGDDGMVHICENCCKVMTTVTMVNVHICTDVASYNCRTCNETFSTGMSLRLHNMYKHKETEGPHKCLPCNKKFLTNAMLQRHENRKHRFMRPYRPRKSSPVYMATPVDLPSKCEKHFGENEMDSGCDQEYVDMEYEFTRKEAAKRRQQDSWSPKVARKKRILQEEKTPEQEGQNLQKDPLRQSNLVTYIDEDEIIQCNLCRLYCLSMAALRTHMANSHSIMGEVCKICEKMYSKGKLIRHMIDQHINPCETYTEDQESIWNIGKNVEEKDAEQLIRMLGMNRFISLCEYQRFSESTLDGAVHCPHCAEVFEGCEDYKFHFFMKHDIMCALCNIEFKSGDKAAIHKTEDHGSVDSYIWFADQTVGALTAATNFYEAAEKSFIEMISRGSDESHDENENEDLEDEDQAWEQYLVAKNDEKCKRVHKMDVEESLAEFLEEDDQKLMIVVTDDDLRSYGIGTQNPNIWGLASKISSTSTELTPKDVKVMLDTYFGK